MPPVSKEKSTKVIRAVAYCRKSTAQEGYEKSLEGQKARIVKLKPAEEGTRYEIVGWYTDTGVSGLKRAHQRPDYARMVNNIRRRRDIRDVLVDQMDRFSRNDEMQTLHALQDLRDLDVRYIHSAQDVGFNQRHS